MSDVEQIIYQVIFPILSLLGELLRPFGVLAAGVVAGGVMRHTLVFKLRMRFYVPLIFLGVFLMFWVAASAQWSGPGSLGAFGLGLFTGYLLLERGKQAAVEEDEQDNS